MLRSCGLWADDIMYNTGRLAIFADTVHYFITFFTIQNMCYLHASKSFEVDKGFGLDLGDLILLQASERHTNNIVIIYTGFYILLYLNSYFQLENITKIIVMTIHCEL